MENVAADTGLKSRLRSVLGLKLRLRLRKRKRRMKKQGMVILVLQSVASDEDE